MLIEFCLRPELRIKVDGESVSPERIKEIGRALYRAGQAQLDLCDELAKARREAERAEGRYADALAKIAGEFNDGSNDAVCDDCDGSRKEAR